MPIRIIRMVYDKLLHITKYLHVVMCAVLVFGLHQRMSDVKQLPVINPLGFYFCVSINDLFSCVRRIIPLYLIVPTAMMVLITIIVIVDIV